MFTTRHYIFLARFFKNELATAQYPEDFRAIERVIKAVAYELEKDNPRFDKALFLKESGVIEL